MVYATKLEPTLLLTFCPAGLYPWNWTVPLDQQQTRSCSSTPSRAELALIADQAVAAAATEAAAAAQAAAATSGVPGTAADFSGSFAADALALFEQEQHQVLEDQDFWWRNQELGSHEADVQQPVASMPPSPPTAQQQQPVQRSLMEEQQQQQPPLPPMQQLPQRQQRQPQLSSPPQTQVKLQQQEECPAATFSAAAKLAAAGVTRRRSSTAATSTPSSSGTAATRTYACAPEQYSIDTDTELADKAAAVARGEQLVKATVQAYKQRTGRKQLLDVKKLLDWGLLPVELCSELLYIKTRQCQARFQLVQDETTGGHMLQCLKCEQQLPGALQAEKHANAGRTTNKAKSYLFVRGALLNIEDEACQLSLDLLIRVMDKQLQLDEQQRQDEGNGQQQQQQEDGQQQVLKEAPGQPAAAASSGGAAGSGSAAAGRNRGAASGDGQQDLSTAGGMVSGLMPLR